ncbi:MAG: hypothetical protein IT536_16215 [Hyphomicrobiales bacterium]|nr:hypothetical protein [Hyphomicrobiales bacterium]
MNFLSKLIIWAVLSLLAAFGARAQDSQFRDGLRRDVHTAQLLICGTAEKAQRFAAEHPDLAGALTGTQSGHAAAQSCLVAGIAYVNGKAVQRVRNNETSYDVTEITIVAVATPLGFLPITPSVVYTLIKVDEQAA